MANKTLQTIRMTINSLLDFNSEYVSF